MYTLNAYLTGHELRLYPAQTLAADSVAFDKIHFDFDDSWDGLGKVALFWDAEGSASPYGVMLDDQDDATVPWEALKDSGCIRFGVYGVSGSGADAVRATSTLVNYSLPEGAWSDDQGEPTPAQQTLIEQAIAALVENVGKSEAAAEAAESAAEEAESSAERAEQAAKDAGYMYFYIDERGHLIYNRTSNVLVEGAPITDEVLKELVGHTPMEVFFGALTGALVALIWLNV